MKKRDKTIALAVVKVRCGKYKKTTTVEVDGEKWEDTEEWDALVPLAGDRMLIAESDKTGRFILWDREGVGIGGTREEGVNIRFHGHKAKEDGKGAVSMEPVIGLHYDWSDIQEMLTGETADFATFVRVFGDRLESNYRAAIVAIEELGLKMREVEDAG